MRFALALNTLHCCQIVMETRMSEESSLTEQEFVSAVDLLMRLLTDEQLDQLQRRGPAAVYTTTVTIWMMTLQRLGGGKTLNATVKDVLAHSRQLFPDNKRLREGTLSETSGAYCEARTRLELQTVEFFADRVSDSLIEASPPFFDGRPGFLLDGTTLTFAPTDELKAAFPPATNQHGESVWPVALLLVAHEIHSSCALPPEIGAMYGPDNTSEARLARRMARRLPNASVVLADSGYGIFSVAHAMVGEGHSILFRLTKSRFRALVKQTERIEQWDGRATHRLTWTPSPKDRKTSPDLPEDASLDVLLHEVPLDGQTPDGDTLYLVTTLPVSSEQAGRFYRRRYDVEHDIRDVKVTLDTENIRARSVEMVRKELLLSMVAYNLVVQFRRQAAAVAGVAPRRLSFTGVWNTFESFLLHQPPCGAAEWRERYEAALRTASRDKLPNRPGRRHPRRAHPRRPKSTKFMKQQAKQINSPPPEKPK